MFGGIAANINSTSRTDTLGQVKNIYSNLRENSIAKNGTPKLRFDNRILLTRNKWGVHIYSNGGREIGNLHVVCGQRRDFDQIKTYFCFFTVIENYFSPNLPDPVGRHAICNSTSCALFKSIRTHNSIRLRSFV